MKNDPISNIKYYSNVLLSVTHNYRFLITKYHQSAREKFTQIRHIAKKINKYMETVKINYSDFQLFLHII
jgi:iron-sulfur cluster repair protein YtfE (RIC family)